MRKKSIIISILCLFCLVSCALGLLACDNSQKESNQGESKFIVVVDEYELEVGSSQNILALHDNKSEIKYTSENTGIATVNSNGEIYGVSSGITFIEVKAKSQTVMCKVTVTDTEYAVVIGYGNVNLIVGSDIKFTAKLLKNGSFYDGDVIWSVTKQEKCVFTSDKNSAEFKATTVGDYVITATSDKASATCNVKVVSNIAQRLDLPTLTVEHCDLVKWSAVEGVSSYGISVNDGDWEKISQTQYSISELSEKLLDGNNLRVKVKCLADSNYDYIDSYISLLTIEHSYSVVELEEATCTQSGVGKFTCTVCERTYTDNEYYEPHKYEENICIKCGQERTPVLLYLYDSTYDCYYVAGVKDNSVSVVFVAGYFDDGLHGRKEVKYITKGCFINNVGITHLILPNTLNWIYGNCFQDMQDLEYISMTGVSEIKNYYHGQSEPRTGFNQFLNCLKLKTVIIDKNLAIDTQAFVENVETYDKPIMTIYAKERGGNISLSTANLWTGDVIYYDESGVDCETWHYAEDGYNVEMSQSHRYRNGTCVHCGMQNPNGLVYNYDATDDCYYLSYSPKITSETVIVPATYTDGIHGVKEVKYLACIGEKGVFEGNAFIKKVILPDTIVSINGDTFLDCINLQTVIMKGVKSLQLGEANRDSATAEFDRIYSDILENSLGIKSMYGMFKGYNFTGCTSLKDIVVCDGFKILNYQKYNISMYMTVNILVNGVKPITNSETVGTYLPYYLSDLETDTCGYWYYVSDDEYIKNKANHEYNENHICNICGAGMPTLTDEQNVNYGYDVDDDCYYVTYSPNVTATTITIPAKFNDNVHGEKDVKYVAMVKDAKVGERGAFQGNTYLQKVILPSTVVSINGKAFMGCSNLVYIEMSGVRILQAGESNRQYSDEQFTLQATSVGLKSMYGAFCGYNFNQGATTINIVVANGFTAQNGDKDNLSTGQILNVYGSGTSLMSTSEDVGTFNFYYYNENPTDNNYKYWHYNGDNEIEVYSQN